MGWGAKGVLGLKDVGWEMHFEDFETPAKVAWVRGLRAPLSRFRGGDIGLGLAEGAGILTQYGDVKAF